MAERVARLSFVEKAGYSLGDAAANFVFMTMILFQLNFYTDVMGISAGAAGTMLLVGRLWDAFFDPMMGVIADRTNERLGRSDVAVILLRKLWARELEALARGKPLKAWSRPAQLEVTVGQWVKFLNTVDPAGRNKHHLYSETESGAAWPRFGQLNFSSGAPTGHHYSAAAPEWLDKPYGFANFLRSARFVLAETAVQGDRAVPEIMRALTALDARADVDVIVIARGGGSLDGALPGPCHQRGRVRLQPVRRLAPRRARPQAAHPLGEVKRLDTRAASW